MKLVAAAARSACTRRAAGRRGRGSTSSAGQGQAVLDERAGSRRRRSSAGRRAGRRYLPNSDSTCQRRARKPSIWSVTPGDAEDDPGRPAVAVRPRSSISTTKTGISDEPRDRQRVRKLLQRSRNGAGRHAVWKGYARGRALSACRASSTPTRTRSSAPCAGAAAARTSGRGATLMLAEAERQTPEPVRRRVRRGLPRDARRGLHRGRRVPLPRLRRGARRCRGGRGGRDRDRGAPRRIRARRACRASGRSRSREYLRQVEDLRGRGHSPSASPPTPCARAPRTGSRRSAATQPPRGCRCTCTPTSSRARSRSAWPSTASGRSSCSTATGCLGERTTVVHATHADGAELDLLAGPARASAYARRPRPTSVTASCPVERCAHARHRDLHRLGLERPHRPARGAARARGDRAPADAVVATSSRPGRCSASVPTKAPARWGSRSGTTSRSTLPTLRCVASKTSSTHSSPAAAPTSS